MTSCRTNGAVMKSPDNGWIISTDGKTYQSIPGKSETLIGGRFDKTVWSSK